MYIYMYIYICTYIYTYVYIYIHTYIYTHTHTHTQIHIHTNISMYTYTYTQGHLHSAITTEDGRLFTWGDGLQGRLGHGDEDPKLAPTQVPTEAFGGWPVVLVDCGRDHTLCVDADGEVWSWGYGGWGRLGHGHVNDLFVPTKVCVCRTLEWVPCQWMCVMSMSVCRVDGMGVVSMNDSHSSTRHSLT